MDIRTIQRQAAASADELLSISEEIGTYVIEAYGTAPAAMTDMQCRILLERCRRLSAKLAAIREELARSDMPDLKGSPEHMEASGYSVAVTRQMIAQNLLVLAQKQELLQGFLAHSDTIQSRLKEAREMSDAAEIVRLRNILRGESAPCKSREET